MLPSFPPEPHHWLRVPRGWVESGEVCWRGLPTPVPLPFDQTSATEALACAPERRRRRRERTGPYPRLQPVLQTSRKRGLWATAAARRGRVQRRTSRRRIPPTHGAPARATIQRPASKNNTWEFRFMTCVAVAARERYVGHMKQYPNLKPKHLSEQPTVFREQPPIPSAPLREAVPSRGCCSRLERRPWAGKSTPPLPWGRL